MSKPSNSIKKVKLPNNTECEIVPDKVGSGTYVASLPNLNADDTLVTSTTEKNQKVAVNNDAGVQGAYVNFGANDEVVFEAGTGIQLNANQAQKKIVVSATGGGGTITDVQVNSTSVVSSGVANVNTINGDYNSSTNKLATKNDLPTITFRRF